jgi:hypothetical protein
MSTDCGIWRISGWLGLCVSLAWVVFLWIKYIVVVHIACHVDWVYK